jgi:predicted DsbA family dithiol-disulfide isomerase
VEVVAIDPDPPAVTPTITVDIYSDVVCPWCYIGKRKFETALSQVGDGLGADVEVTYRPHQLDPTASPDTAQILDHVTRAASEVGIEFHMDRALRANTLLAHRLLWLAAQPDSPVAQALLKERLLRAYFSDGLDVGDPDVLADCAAEVGFDRDEVDAFLASDRGIAEVQAELREGYEQGITAVPTFVFEGRWAIPGAQEPDTFVRVLEKMADRATADAGD